jgi:hypothetical protein
MRALFCGALLLVAAGNLASANGEEAQIQIVICNEKLNPPCRNYPTTMAVPVSPKIAEVREKYSFQMKDLNEEELQKVFSLLGIDKSKINLAPQ